ncbi:hypothetical protein PSEG_04047 [Pseudomonas sp. Nvir]|nr:hypothetical protein PSNVIR_04179 [Pseudomonas sp. Nvir]
MRLREGRDIQIFAAFQQDVAACHHYNIFSVSRNSLQLELVSSIPIRERIYNGTTT